MARQALIKLRRGSGAPADGALQEGELAIDISAKKLYSANATGNSFTLSGKKDFCNVVCPLILEVIFYHSYWLCPLVVV